MKKSKKFIALLLTLVLVLSTAVTVYAHSWPDNPGDWTKDDWKAWDDYWRQSWKDWDNWDWWYDWDDWDDCDNHDDCDDYDWWHHEWEKEHHHKKHQDQNNWQKDYNKYNNEYNYWGYNYYAGILDIYDAATEDQAATLARIINIYAHGVVSRTAQAAVGWAVMNSVDASGSGANVCTVAGNFSYDYNANTIDDYNRDLVPLARDIIFRWKAGRAGVTSNGRVLPTNYYYVASTGSIVTFGSNPNEAIPVQSFGYASPYGN